jgi:hypothetical protein
MTHRLIALFVCFLFATQALAVVPTILAASSGEHAVMTSGHCAGMSTPAEKTQHCPHCQDLATSSSGCASYCAVALPSAPVILMTVAATAEFPRTSVPALLTRSDSPPTPPPIR